MGRCATHQATAFFELGEAPSSTPTEPGGDNSFPIKGVVPGRTAPGGLPPPSIGPGAPGSGTSPRTAGVLVSVFVLPAVGTHRELGPVDRFPSRELAEHVLDDVYQLLASSRMAPNHACL